MKKYLLDDEVTMITGTAREIKSLYTNMVERGYFSIFSSEPKFNMSKMYGLTYSGYADTFEDGISIVNSDTIVRLLATT